MLPSEKLRILISKTYNIDLEKYAWPEDFKSLILSIQLDASLESYAKTMQEVYDMGFNIGHCGLTSRYMAIKFKNAILHYGTCSILKGTKASPNGNHAWVVINNILIDTTLMLCIPLEKIQEFGYSSEKVIAEESARILSEYDTFSNEFLAYQKDEQEFENDLLKISQ